MIAVSDDTKFTPKAAVLWSAISEAGRERILANVFCGKCRRPVRITNFGGDEQNGDIVLKGECSVCGSEVVRVVETSEQDRSGN